jgi:hypothetical protein
MPASVPAIPVTPERTSDNPPVSTRPHMPDEDNRARVLAAGRDFIKKNVELLRRLAK